MTDVSEPSRADQRSPEPTNVPGSTLDIAAIDVDRTAQVTVTFGDGIVVRFTLPELRLACPCADCDGRRQRGAPVAPALDDGRSVTIIAVELAGAFGLDLDWSDGHRTGIYGWAFLREAFDAGRLGTRL